MDYQRLVSYIYSYPEGVKGRNVGFAKALVHQGQFKLNISLRGVKTDSPEMFQRELRSFLGIKSGVILEGKILDEPEFLNSLLKIKPDRIV